MKMKKVRIFCLTMLVVVSMIQVVVAAEQGTLRLRELPTKSHVYVDGVLVTPQRHEIHLSPGWHEIQVEQNDLDLAQDIYHVQAMRRLVEIRPQQSTTVFVRPYIMPVLATGKTVSRSGPMGPPGPPGHLPPMGIISSPDIQVLPPPSLVDAKNELRGSLLAHVRDVEEQTKSYQNQVCTSITAVPDMYWYDPDFESVFDSQAASGPMGPPGWRGPIGPPSPVTPQRVLILLGEAGRPLLPAMVEQARKKLGLQEISDNLKAAVQRASELREKIPATAMPHLRRINIYTPALKEKLEQEKAKALAAGLTSPPGRRGPTGPMSPPWPVRTIQEEYQLNPAQMEQVMEMLLQDEYLQRQIEQLRWFEEDLKIWLAEGEQRVAPQ